MAGIIYIKRQASRIWLAHLPKPVAVRFNEMTTYLIWLSRVTSLNITDQNWPVLTRPKLVQFNPTRDTSFHQKTLS
jgi:hypothetical protein